LAAFRWGNLSSPERGISVIEETIADGFAKPIRSQSFGNISISYLPLLRMGA
jgi:hypothetical protein